MKILKTFLLVVFVVIIFRIDLFSTIYSRIEGVLKDKDTSDAIKGANVYLFIERTKKYETQTDSKGVFIFKKVEPEKEYYVVGEKKGYISNVAKFKRNEELQLKEVKIEYKRSHTTLCVTSLTGCPMLRQIMKILTFPAFCYIEDNGVNRLRKLKAGNFEV
jgi:hypothetical protein